MKFILSFLGVFLLATNIYAVEIGNLFFASSDNNGIPRGRTAPPNAIVTIDDGKLNISLPEKGSLIYTVYITPDLGSRLHLSGKIKTTNIVTGKESWKNARIAVRFVDSNWKQVGSWPKVVNASGTTQKQPIDMLYSIPDNAWAMLIEPANFGESGLVEYFDLNLQPVSKNLLLAPNPNGIPQEGKKANNVSAEVEIDSLSFVIDGTGNTILSIPLESTWKSLKLDMKMKTNNVIRGDADWKNARIGLRFYAESPIGSWPNIFQASGTSDWIECSRVYEIPEGATSLQFEPANFGNSGKVEFKDVTLTVHELK